MVVSTASDSDDRGFESFCVEMLLCLNINALFLCVFLGNKSQNYLKSVWPDLANFRPKGDCLPLAVT
jgi:hypothetical protein